jgi:hypothetical protein
MPIDTEKTMQFAQQYYLGRVFLNLLATAVSSFPSNDEKHALILFTTKLFLNKYTENDLNEMPESFKWVGLYDTSTRPPTPVCPAVTSSIHRALADSKHDLIQVLAERASTHGIALKIFVKAAFRRRSFPKTIKATCTNLQGRNEWSLNGRSLEFWFKLSLILKSAYKTLLMVH